MARCFLVGHSPVECSLDNWDDCKEVVKTSLNTQLRHSKDVVDGYTRSLNFASTPYAQSGLILGNSILKTRTDLADEAERQQLIQLHIKDILNLESSKLSESRIEQLEQCKKDVDDNLDKLYDAIFECQDSNLDSINCSSLEELDQNPINEELIQKKNISVVGPYVGYNGGQAFTTSCQNFMTGVSGKHGSLLDQVAPMCDDGGVANNFGKLQSHAFLKSCPAGKVIVGFKASEAKH